MTASSPIHRIRTLLGVSLLASAALLSACSLPTVRPPAQQAYRLQAADVRSAALPTAVVIALLPVDAAPGLRSSAMLYSRRPDQLDPYRDSEWLDTPASLIGNAIAETLSRQPWVSAVQTQTVLAPTPWRLHCDLTRLEHDVRGDAGTARLGLTCQLANQDRGTIAAHWRFDGAQPLAHNDAAGFATAAQTLLDKALDELVSRVRTAVAAPTAG